jgi:hypothetical protein
MPASEKDSSKRELAEAVAPDEGRGTKCTCVKANWNEYVRGSVSTPSPRSAQ